MADDQQPDEQSLEKSSESSTSNVSEQAHNEANAGKADLVQKQKDYIDYLKGGGTSGITDQFGKPSFKYSVEHVKAAMDHKGDFGRSNQSDSTPQYRPDFGRPGDPSQESPANPLGGETGDTQSKPQSDKSSESPASPEDDKSEKKSDASRQVSNSDGSVTYLNDDNSQMTVDKNGRVIALTQADGRGGKFDYDSKGELSKINLPDGAAQTRRPDGTWVTTDKNGKETGRVNGDISVTKEGDVVFVGKDGNSQVSHLDGSKTVINSDQSQLTMDKNGKVTTLTQADGDTAKFHYDKSGTLNKIELPDGGAQTRQADGTWMRTDKDGKEVGKLNGDVFVTQSGDVVYADKNGEVQVSHLDASRTYINKDQSQITYDKDGKVTSLTQSDGDSAKFEYDRSGKLRRFSLPDGGHQTRNDDGTWTRTDKSGKELSKLDGEMSVKDNGDIVLENKDGSGQISHLDGSKTIINADKSEKVLDMNGRVVAIKQADGDRASFEYDERGDLNKINLPDGGAQVRNPDGSWSRTDESGKEIKRLDGDISVTPDGDVVLIGKDGRSQISHLDGSKTFIEANQSQTTVDMEGRVVNIGYPDGTRNRVAYDADSKPSSIITTTADGDSYTWKKEGDGWKRYDSSGKEIDKMDGDVSVESDGSIVVKNKDGSVSIQRPDGRQE